METIVSIRGIFLFAVWTNLCAPQIPDHRCDPFFAERNTFSSHEACRRSNQYDELDKLLTDISHSGSLWTHSFAYNTVIGMYQFIHPCVSYSEGASAVFSSDYASIVGRRRREDFRNRQIFLEAEQDLDRLLHSIRSQTNINCVEALIDRHREAAGRFWFQDHPDLSAQTTLHTASDHSTTTLTTPTTASTTATTDSITYPPIRCWNCSGLDCLLYPDSHTGQPCPADQTFCMVSVTDQSSDRHIDRSCASASMCDSLYLTQTLNNADCSNVERTILSANTHCYFCCVGDNCNKPPALLPEVTSLYSKP